MSWGRIAHAARQRWYQQHMRARRLTPGLVAGILAVIALLVLTRGSWRNGHELIAQAEAQPASTAGYAAMSTASMAPTATQGIAITPTRSITATRSATVNAGGTVSQTTPIAPSTLVTITTFQSPLPTPDVMALISATLNAPISVSVPLPGEGIVPHVVPDSPFAPARPLSSTTPLTTSSATTGPVPPALTAHITVSTTSVTDTASTSATTTITEALSQPVAVAPGGIGEMVAAARARNTDTDAPPTTDTPSAAPEPAESDAPAAMPDAPVPDPTPAIEPTPDGTVRTSQVPILMYHYLSTPPANADVYRLDLSVTPERFAAHLDAMQQAGYTTISLYTWLANLIQGTPLPEKPVVITFDDGYRDNYENAFPLLRERGMIATFFIVTDFIDEQRPAYLTWDMVREMYAAGMSIESHGRNHVSLQNKDADYLIWQALGSLETIEYELGVRPRFVSYPAGDYDQATIDIFSSAGYWAGFTTVQGATHRSDDLFQVKRVRVHGTTTPEELLRVLALDW